MTTAYAPDDSREVALSWMAPMAPKSPVEVAKNLRGTAHGHYVRMQREWFLFARTITTVQKTRAYLKLGLDSFRAYCLAEYPELSYVQLTKMITVVKAFGPALEERWRAAPEEPMPTLEALYVVAAAKHKFHDDKIATREIGNLAAKVINNEMSFSRLKEKLTALRRERKAEATDAAINDLVAELEKDIVASGGR